MVEASTPVTESATAWVALPGLFTQDEIAEVVDLEVRACPLVQQGGVVFYGVYVRERCTPCAVHPTRNAA